MSFIAKIQAIETAISRLLLGKTSLLPEKTTNCVTGFYEEAVNRVGRHLRCALLGFVLFRVRCRLFFAEKPGADDAELIHKHQG